MKKEPKQRAYSDKKAEKIAILNLIPHMMDFEGYNKPLKEFLSGKPSQFRSKKFRKLFRKLRNALGDMMHYVENIRDEFSNRTKTAFELQVEDLWQSIPGEITKKEWLDACVKEWPLILKLKINRKFLTKFFNEKLK